MKALSFILLMLAVFALLGGAGADEAEDITDEEIDEEGFWQSDLIDVPGNATFSIDIEMTDPEMGERDNFTGIDIYLLTEDEFGNYENDEEFENLEHGSWEHRSGIEWSKPLEDDLISFYIIIDNRNNSRDSDAVPNGTVTVDINWTVIEAEVIDPIDPGSSDTSDGDMTSFIILAVIVLAVMMGIGMAVRRGGSGGEGDDEDGSAEKEDYFGRIRIG